MIRGETAPAAFWSKREQAFASLAPEEWELFKEKVRLLPAPADVERGGSRVDSPFELSDGFFRKLDHDVAAAVEQMRQYDPNQEADWIVFICLNTEDLIGDGRQAHLRMIDAHLAGKSNPASLVFYFLTNNFEHHLEMTNAEVYID